MRGLKTVDVARGAGCSVQQVRNLERDGVLPSVARTASGYRVYTALHVASALAYRLLAAGAISDEPIADVRADDVLTVSELASAPAVRSRALLDGGAALSRVPAGGGPGSEA